MKPRSASLILFAALTVVAVQMPASARQPARQGPSVPGKETPPAKTDPPVQPIPYSHKRHLALGLKCRECHPNPEPGDRMTIPPAAKCMSCHAVIARNQPAIQKLVWFAKSNQPIPWIRVYAVAGWVYWNHRTHLEAKLTCARCHGPVEQMEVVKKATDVTTMAGCIDCHRKNDVSSGCRTCHAGG